MIGILIRDNRGQKEVEYFLTVERKELSSQDSKFNKISWKNYGEIKTFSDEEKLRDSIASKLAIKNC